MQKPSPSLSLFSSLIYPSPDSLREEYKENIGSPVLPLFSFIDLDENFGVLIFTGEALDHADFVNKYAETIINKSNGPATV